MAALISSRWKRIHKKQAGRKAGFFFVERAAPLDFQVLKRPSKAKHVKSRRALKKHNSFRELHKTKLVPISELCKKSTL